MNVSTVVTTIKMKMTTSPAVILTVSDSPLVSKKMNILERSIDL